MQLHVMAVSICSISKRMAGLPWLAQSIYMICLHLCSETSAGGDRHTCILSTCPQVFDWWNEYLYLFGSFDW